MAALKLTLGYLVTFSLYFCASLPIHNITNSTQDIYTDIEFIIPTCADYNLTGSYCLPCFDGVMIWSMTKAGETAEKPCPSIDEPSRGIAKRSCLVNGTWSSRADYAICISHIKNIKEKINAKEEDIKYNIEIHKNTSYIYLAGFALSNVAMITAVAIFCKFHLRAKRDTMRRREGHLRCMRNIIHCQLLTAITLKNFLWMALVTNTFYFDIFEKPVECKIIITSYKFFQLAQFSWMFVEGLYLFLVIVRTFMTKMLRLRHFMAIGWGIPFAITLAWVILNIAVPQSGDNTCWMSSEILAPANAVEILSIALLLMANAVFMMSVVHTLVGKLKNSMLNETRQYRKAVKATIVLIPLLGILYLLLFLAPGDSNRTVYTAWLYSNAILQSTQGFTVACVYCFMNSEVRASIAKCQRRWRDERTLPSISVTWWSVRRRSSTATTRREDTDTDTYLPSGRNSRRVSADNGSNSKGSNNNITDTSLHNEGLTKSKRCKDGKLAPPAPLLEEASD